MECGVQVVLNQMKDHMKAHNANQMTINAKRLGKYKQLFKCTLCEEQFLTEDSLKNHKKKKHIENKKVQKQNKKAEDEESVFEEPKIWKEKQYLNSDKESIGVTIKSTNKFYKTSAGKLVPLMKRRNKEYTLNGNKFKVIRHIYKKDALCPEIEVEKKDGTTEKIEVTIYEPKNTIVILRKPETDHSFVVVTHMFVVDMLDKFIGGSTVEEVLVWISKAKTPVTLKVKIQKCSLCDYATKTSPSLKKHYSTVHASKLPGYTKVVAKPKISNKTAAHASYRRWP